MKKILIVLLLAVNILTANDSLFFKQPTNLDVIKKKVNIVWQNRYDVPLDLFYKTDDVWIKIDSNNIKNHYNNFDLPEKDSIWFKIAFTNSQPMQENFYSDFFALDHSEIRGISVVNGQAWVITKDNYLYNITSGQSVTLPSETKSAYGMVSRTNNLLFAQNEELWSMNVGTMQYSKLATMSNLTKNIYLVNDSLFTGGLNFVGFYNFSNSTYQEIPMQGQVYDIKKVHNKIYVACDRTVYVMNENFSILNSYSFPYTIGAIGVVDDVIVVGSLGQTLDFIQNGTIINSLQFGSGGIIDIEMKNSTVFVASRDGSIRQFFKDGAEQSCSIQNLTAITEITFSNNSIIYGTRDGYIGSYNPCQNDYISDSILCYIQPAPLISSVEKVIESIDQLIESDYSNENSEIWNLKGQLIYRGIIRDFRREANGVYIVRIESLKKTFVMTY